MHCLCSFPFFGGQRTAAIQTDQLILQPWSVLLLLALRVGRLVICALWLFPGCQTISGCFCCFVISFVVTASPPPKDSLNGSSMPRVSQLYASVRNDVGLGFLSTYLVAVAVPFLFVRGALFSRYSHVQARSFFRRCASYSAYCRGPSFSLSGLWGRSPS